MPSSPPRCRGSRAKVCRVSTAHWNSRRVDEAGTLLGERVEGVGQREDHVEVRDGQELRAARVDPARLRQGLALGTVSVAAGVVDGPRGPAAVAALEMTAEGRGATAFDRAQGAALHGRQPVRALERLAVGADDRGQSGPARLASCRRRPGRRRRAHGVSSAASAAGPAATGARPASSGPGGSSAWWC